MPASRSRCLVSCETSYVFDTMREDLTCNVLPIVKDAMDGMAYNAGGVASLPSNGYYGYQPHLAHKVKTENTQETMDYECYAAQSVLRLNRKRAWEFGDGAEFKKRRQNDFVKLEDRRKVEGKIKCKNKENLDEDLLLGIHGCSAYHWNVDSL
ncbi:uncharacterized protein LOC109598544 isoform X1 [Aethina tumida]|uniref:uncharacterized protein LOC109598544 isoform X1 n=1 Tax=Aethina tumida TaxID=116153 RepID=UPI00096B431F|nr:uncharacterized protein LOC109598544 isoform X1 [Aethina tumida]